MGQKTNPNILRVGITQKYNNKYIEKKLTEQAFYNFKNNELENFIYKFFKNNNLIIFNYQLHYLDENTLHVFVAYYSKIESSTFIKLNNIKQYSNYQKLINKNILNTQYNNKLKSINKLSNNLFQLNTNKNVSKLNIKQLKNKFFFYFFFKSLIKFINKKLKIILTLHQINKNLKKIYDKKELKILQKNLIKLQKYKSNKYFKEGFNTLFFSTKYLKSSQLIASFIANNLKTNKSHKFFLKFLKTLLNRLIKNSTNNIKGIKIKIKGRLNGRPRARHKVLYIGNGMPNLTLNAKINYSEVTAYTINGTLGVKVWINSF